MKLPQRRAHRNGSRRKLTGCAQAKLDLFDAILAGDAHRTDGAGKVRFSTDSPEAWFETIEDSGYWYATGLNLTGLPPAACP